MIIRHIKPDILLDFRFCLTQKVMIFQWLVYTRQKTTFDFALNSTIFYCCMLWWKFKVIIQKLTRPPSASMIACCIFGWRSMSLWISLIGRVSQVCSMACRHISIVRRLFAFCSRLSTSNWASSKEFANSVSQGLLSWLRGAYFPLTSLPGPCVRS